MAEVPPVPMSFTPQFDEPNTLKREQVPEASWSTPAPAPAPAPVPAPVPAAPVKHTRTATHARQTRHQHHQQQQPQAPQIVSLPVPAALSCAKPEPAPPSAVSTPTTPPSPPTGTPAGAQAQAVLLALPSAQERGAMAARFLAATAGGVRAARQTLGALGAELDALAGLLPALRARQRTALGRRDAAALQALLVQASETVGRLRLAGERLDALEHAHLLLPDELRAATTLRQRACVAAAQAELYLLEAQQALAGSWPPLPGVPGASTVARLVITAQPFPLVLSKGKLADAPLDVAVLTGAAHDLAGCGNSSGGSGSEGEGDARLVQRFVPVIEHCTTSKAVAQNIVAITAEECVPGTATTRLTLRTTNGSRMVPVALRVAATVSTSTSSSSSSSGGEGGGGGAATTLESQCSQPFIVITNENQYEESNGSLLRYLAFGTRAETPWPRFANALQRHFLQTTKQDGSAPPPAVLPAAAPVSAAAVAAALTPEDLPVRALAVRELEYIHARFFGGRAAVAATQFDAFWAWFGKLLQRMRTTRQICGMWRDGLLWGFVGRADIERALAPQPPGAFVVRFSERHPGQFAIAYRTRAAAASAAGSAAGNATTAAVKHYLVRPEEISTQKTLPDFLQDTPGLAVIVRVLHSDYGTALDPPPCLPEPLYIPLAKAEALEKFLSKREPVTLVGYEPSLAPAAMAL